MIEHEYKVGDKVVLNCTKEEFIKEVVGGSYIYKQCFTLGYASITLVREDGGVAINGSSRRDCSSLLSDELKYIKPFVEEKAEEEEVENTSWTDKHYDNKYYLLQEDKDTIAEGGYIRLDTYKVNHAWGINSVEPTGAGFHCLKTLNRIPNNKNPLERELRALVKQVNCWAKAQGIDLSDTIK